MTRPNILLVVLDSVRARNTSLHGHVNRTTPGLERFATDRATWYTQARAPAVWSLPSHASMFTGYHVVEHGFTERSHRLQPDESVWERLGTAGYETGLFSPNPYLTELPTGLDAGFQTIYGTQDLPFPDALNPRQFVQEHGQGRLRRYLGAARSHERPVQSVLNGLSEKLSQDAPWLLPDWLRGSDSAETYVDLFLDWQAGREGPWAACLNLMDAHTPYSPGPAHDHWGGEYAQELQADMENQVWEFYGGERPWWQLGCLEALYDGAIHRMDEQFTRIIDSLESREALEDTLVVVTADHGEGFGEPSRFRDGLRLVGHQSRGIEESLLHVPLVVKRPGQERPAVIEDVATLTRFPSVVASVLEDSDTPARFSPEGPVIASSEGLDSQKEWVAQRYCDDLEPFRGSGHAVYEGAGDAVRKFVHWDDDQATIRVFDARTAVRESRVGRNRIDEFRSTLRERNVLERTDQAVSRETKRRLEDLGYA